MAILDFVFSALAALVAFFNDTIINLGALSSTTISTTTTITITDIAMAMATATGHPTTITAMDNDTVASWATESFGLGLDYDDGYPVTNGYSADYYLTEWHHMAGGLFARLSEILLENLHPLLLVGLVFLGTTGALSVACLYRATKAMTAEYNGIVEAAAVHAAGEIRFTAARAMRSLVAATAAANGEIGHFLDDFRHRQSLFEQTSNQVEDQVQAIVYYVNDCSRRVPAELRSVYNEYRVDLDRKMALLAASLEEALRNAFNAELERFAAAIEEARAAIPAPEEPRQPFDGSVAGAAVGGKEEAKKEEVVEVEEAKAAWMQFAGRTVQRRQRGRQGRGRHH